MEHVKIRKATIFNVYETIELSNRSEKKIDKEKRTNIQRERFKSIPNQPREKNQSTRLFDLSWPVIVLSSVANLSYSALFWDACFLRISVAQKIRYDMALGYKSKSIPKSR